MGRQGAEVWYPHTRSIRLERSVNKPEYQQILTMGTSFTGFDRNQSNICVGATEKLFAVFLYPVCAFCALPVLLMLLYAVQISGLNSFSQKTCVKKSRGGRVAAAAPRDLQVRITFFLGAISKTQLLNTDSRYQFVPPHKGNFWPRALAWLVPGHLRRVYGGEQVQVGAVDKLLELQRAGHGILIAPNHCRMSDALVLQALSAELGQPFHAMVSSHLFRGSRLQSFLLRRMGAFSIYREGIDRAAVDQAVEILATASRPLVIFPEGALSQANDWLNALQERVSFIARTAPARCRCQQEASERRVYVVPVGIRYVFDGDLDSTAETLLSSIEKRLSWSPLTGLPLTERIVRVGGAAGNVWSGRAGFGTWLEASRAAGCCCCCCCCCSAGISGRAVCAEPSVD